MNRAPQPAPLPATFDSVVRVRPLEPERLAERAQRAWTVMPLDERLHRIGRWQRRLLDRRESLVNAIASVSGVSPYQVSAFEIEPLFRAFGALVTSTKLGSAHVQHDARLVAHPLGVVELAGDSAFARPLFELASAITIGNAVLTDRGEHFGGAWQLARSAFLQSGLPEDLWVQAGDEATRWLEAPIPAHKPKLGPAMIVALSTQGIAAMRSLVTALQPAVQLRHRAVLARVCTTSEHAAEVREIAPDVELHTVRHHHDVGELLTSFPRPHIVHVLDPNADRTLADQWRALIVTFDATPLSDLDVLMATEAIGSRFIRHTVIINHPLPPLTRAWNRIAKRWQGPAPR